MTVRQRIFCLCFTGGTAHGLGACPASLYDAICTIQAVLRDIVVSPAVIAALEIQIFLYKMAIRLQNSHNNDRMQENADSAAVGTA